MSLVVGLSAVDMGNFGADGHRDVGKAGPNGGSGPDRTVLQLDPESIVPIDSVPAPIELETSEVPFVQPQPAAEQGRPRPAKRPVWLDQVGKWPVVAVAVAAMAIMFAAFISGTDRSLSGDTVRGDSTSARPGDESLAAQPSSGSVDAGARSSRTGVAGEEARSTGSAAADGEVGFYSGQLVEPDEALTTEASWVTTTTVPVTTSSVALETTISELTTTEPPTSESTTTAVEGPWVRPIGPGSGDPQNPTILEPGGVTLAAEGSEGIRYRFTVYVRNGSNWSRIGRSRWRSDSSWTISTDRLVGQVLGWTVTAREKGWNSGESGRLHIQIGAKVQPPDEDDD